jgi:hypothetical protein
MPKHRRGNPVGYTEYFVLIPMSPTASPSNGRVGAEISNPRHRFTSCLFSSAKSVT